jgi:hypothetical protein
LEVLNSQLLCIWSAIASFGGLQRLCRATVVPQIIRKLVRAQGLQRPELVLLEALACTALTVQATTASSGGKIYSGTR